MNRRFNVIIGNNKNHYNNCSSYNDFSFWEYKTNPILNTVYNKRYRNTFFNMLIFFAQFIYYLIWLIAKINVASPVVKFSICEVAIGFLRGFLGTITSEPGSALGYKLKNKNFLVLATSPFA